jgi:hypothetical protein
MTQLQVHTIVPSAKDALVIVLAEVAGVGENRW